MSDKTTTPMRKLAELIQGVRVAMMHTRFEGQPPVGNGMAQHVRPMYTQKIDPETFNGELYFFADAGSAKIGELRSDASILLTYAAPDKNRFITVFGTADCEHDPAKATELWNIHAKGWWPEGPTSQSLMVIRVRVSTAEYWDGPSSVSYALKLLKAVATSERIETYGDHGRI